MSNTKDTNVPALSRHVFTEGGCSNGTHDQPCFNEQAGAFTETWDGYIYVPESMENVKLTVAADDNACFYLHAFPDCKAELLGRGPLGGGNYTSAESTPIPMLKKGYYRVHVSYTNIDYPGKNIARLDVLLNGEQITIGQLETHNTLSEDEVTKLYDFYDFVSYPEKNHLKYGLCLTKRTLMKPITNPMTAMNSFPVLCDGSWIVKIRVQRG